MAATLYYLTRMVSGDHRDGVFQQRMMRGRVGSQAFTILVMCASGVWAGQRANRERLERRRLKELEEQEKGGAVPS